MRQMRIILISLFHYDNFALRLLFSYLEAQHVPVSYISFKRLRQKGAKILKNGYWEAPDYHAEATEGDINVLLGELDKLNPALIGIGLQSAHFQVAKRLTQAIKAKFKVPVIWGGTHPTIDPQNCIKHTDAICVGEGFDALLELSQAILQGRDYTSIKNLWINDGDKIIRNPARPLLENLDILPFASFNSENKLYIDDGSLQAANNIDFLGVGLTDDPLKTTHQTMTSFGCPMKCSFCIGALKVDKFRRRSVANVIKELEQAKQKNPYLKMVFFWDNIFQVNKKWCLEFAEEYKKKINLQFYAYTHPLFTDMDILVALRKAGWVLTTMGIQSGSYSLRKQIYHRDETNEQILEAAQRLNRLKKINTSKAFWVYYDYVKNNPLEGKENLKESLKLILKLPKGFTLQAFNLSFFPNYLITKEYLEKGLISSGHIEGNIDTSATNWISTFDTKKGYHGPLRRHEYYYLLFSLAQFEVFPNLLIELIEKKKLFFKNLGVLYWLCRIVRSVDFFFHLPNCVRLLGLINITPLKLKNKHKTSARLR